ncbi:MAG: hypothetical protein IPK99_03625 [Flavobacteriales bacterium]|nr:hypothetical protein [Flavobacteriales bacterium]
MTTNTPPDPGVDGAITLCSTDAAVSLFPQLGGTPDAGGTWSGPSPVVGGMFDPAGMTAGVYTYTITGTAPCPDANATVTTTNTPPDPGVDGALTVCSTDGAVISSRSLAEHRTPVVLDRAGGGAFRCHFHTWYRCRWRVHLHRQWCCTLPQRDRHGHHDHQHAARPRRRWCDHTLQHRCGRKSLRTTWRNT